ncbi:DUF3365 domain-containing protein, partial [candidate division KSB1 bacterium]
LVIVWTVVIASSLLWNIRQSSLKIIEIARVQSRIAHEKDVIYRRWNASHGGVYVPVTESTIPNPYLSDIVDRDITSSSGKTLTLMNPAYMTRQVHELAEEENNVHGHITSLNPIRPENAADPWETEALKAFELGIPEKSSIEDLNGKVYLRLMKPLVTEKGCLKCHAKQGYKEGDIRGGISVSVPMLPLKEILDKETLGFKIAHFIIWLAGMSLIFFGMFRVNRSEKKRRKAEDEKEIYIAQLQTALDEIKTLKDFIPICVECKNIRNDEGYWEQVELYITKQTGSAFSHGICPNCTEKLYPGLNDKKD